MYSGFPICFPYMKYVLTVVLVALSTNFIIRAILGSITIDYRFFIRSPIFLLLCTAGSFLLGAKIVSFMLFGTNFSVFLPRIFSFSWDAGKLFGKSLTLSSLAFNLCKVKSGRVNKNKIELLLLPKRKGDFSPYSYLEYFLRNLIFVNPSSVPLICM